MGERRGTLEVETVSGVEEDRAAFETLADQVALALETVALASEKATPSADASTTSSRASCRGRRGEVLAQQTAPASAADARRHTHVHRPPRLHELLRVAAGRRGDLGEPFSLEQTETIMAHGGTIIAYLGDGLMAFGAPIGQPTTPTARSAPPAS
jgi:hypothetical protein